jgi:hypothetical protein
MVGLGEAECGTKLSFEAGWNEGLSLGFVAEVVEH